MIFIAGLIVIVTSLSAMIAIVRRSRFVPQIAIIAGAAGALFFANLRALALPGVVLSILAVVLGLLCAAMRRRRRRQRIMVLSESGVWRLPTEVFLSSSGRWRTL